MYNDTIEKLNFQSSKHTTISRQADLHTLKMVRQWLNDSVVELVGVYFSEVPLYWMAMRTSTYMLEYSRVVCVDYKNCK